MLSETDNNAFRGMVAPDSAASISVSENTDKFAATDAHGFV